MASGAAPPTQPDELDGHYYQHWTAREWFERVKLDHSRGRSHPWDTEFVMHFAASGGFLEVLQWAHSVGIPWDQQTCGWAAFYGHLHILRWAREYGCPWDGTECSGAVCNKHWRVLQWLVDNGAPCPESIFEDAKSQGHTLRPPPPRAHRR